MVFVPNGLKAVRALPEKDADRLTRVGPGEKLFGTGKTAPGVAPVGDTGWIEVFLPDDKTTGWIIAAEFSEAPDPTPRPLDEEFFVRSCLTVERELNSEPTVAPWYVAADFLIARALLETGLSAGGGDPSRPLGPLAMMPGEWEAFLASGMGPVAEFASSDRRLLTAQIFACACAASRTTKELSDAVSPGGDPDDGAYVPSYLDLFLAYIIDVPTAARLADPSLDKTQTLGAIGFSADTIAALAARSGLSNTKASSTVSAFLKNASETLARLLDAAFDRMKTLANDELPKGQGGVPPWLVIARSELDRPVSETVNADRLLTYFQTINFPVGGTVPHWCGAFVGFCVKTAGGPIPDGPARAANWKTWGNRSFPVGASEIPLGAVVVLKPQDPTTSGHVAFFEKFVENRKVRLLGGNQDDAVSEKEFSVTEIAAIRMQAQELPIGAANAFDMTKAEVRSEFQRYGDLIIERFKMAGFDTIHQLAAALANAIRESGLNPKAASKPPEKSYGLFQCNQTAGLGKGYSMAQLMDPEQNIALIIAEARRSRSFVSASTLEAAVEAFVKYVERPRDTTAEISVRLRIAKLLLGV
ncbi:phage tail tip lysozyme [Rhizobium ruizarguesonis]